jgi:ribosomal protein S5
VTSKGRLETLHVTTAVGNMRGLVGVGICSGSQLQQVMLNSLLLAYKSVVPVPLYRGHTIFHPVDLTARKVGGRVGGGG